MRTLLYALGLLLLTPTSYWLLSRGEVKAASAEPNQGVFASDMRTGAELMHLYLPFLKGKRLGLVVNHTSVVGQTHLVDTLRALGMDIRRIFAPEHGFRGQADAGEALGDHVDARTKIPIISVYGKNKKPKPEQLADLDLVIFDIQDVGVRFYTYTSTMTYIMEVCAETDVPLLVLDRPNPNGHYVDGPVLRPEQKSFVGLHPVPIVHGLTVAEYARMINGEGWIPKPCQLYHVECQGYKPGLFYEIPIPPSPNLRSMASIYLYPSLCFFEGTTVSLGRGTPQPFECYGHPAATQGDFKFVPRPGPGSKNPPQQGKTCRGFFPGRLPLAQLQAKTELDLNFLLDFYRAMPPAEQKQFFTANHFFDLLAGNTELRAQIVAGKTEAEIRESWQADLQAYQVLRQKYNLY